MMRKVLLLSFVAVLSLGCAITDYPVIFDTRGADLGGVMSGQYDEAYIIPSGQVATLWADGSDELYTLVVQDWKANWLAFASPATVEQVSLVTAVHLI